MDSRTIYVGHKEPPAGAEAYIPQRYPDNRIVSSKVALALAHVAAAGLRAWLRAPCFLHSRLRTLRCPVHAGRSEDKGQGLHRGPLPSLPLAASGALDPQRTSRPVFSLTVGSRV